MRDLEAWRPDPLADVPEELLQQLFHYDPSLKQVWNSSGMNSQVKLATKMVEMGLPKKEIKTLLLLHRRENDMDLMLDNISYYDYLLREVRRGLHKRAS